MAFDFSTFADQIMPALQEYKNEATTQDLNRLINLMPVGKEMDAVNFYQNRGNAAANLVNQMTNHLMTADRDQQRVGLEGRRVDLEGRRVGLAEALLPFQQKYMGAQTEALLREKPEDAAARRVMNERGISDLMEWYKQYHRAKGGRPTTPFEGFMEAYPDPREAVQQYYDALLKLKEAEGKGGAARLTAADTMKIRGELISHQNKFLSEVQKIKAPMQGASPEEKAEHFQKITALKRYFVTQLAPLVQTHPELAPDVQRVMVAIMNHGDPTTGGLMDPSLLGHQPRQMDTD